MSKRLCLTCKGKNSNGSIHRMKFVAYLAIRKVDANSSVLNTLFEGGHGTSQCNLIYLQTTYKL